jgi:hypothetical protein
MDHKHVSEWDAVQGRSVRRSWTAAPPPRLLTSSLQRDFSTPRLRGPGQLAQAFQSSRCPTTACTGPLVAYPLLLPRAVGPRRPVVRSVKA